MYISEQILVIVKFRHIPM